MLNTSIDLDQTVIKFQEKDIKAFETLYNMYSASMIGVIDTIINNKEIAQEVMQDVFVKAWKQSETYSSKKGRFFTWILNISRNAAIDKLRSKSYKNSKQNINTNFIINNLSTHDNLVRKTNTIGISEMVEKLPPKYKQIIHLLYFKGYTQKEASDSLNIPLGTLKTRNRDGIIKLRNLLVAKQHYNNKIAS